MLPYLLIPVAALMAIPTVAAVVAMMAFPTAMLALIAIVIVASWWGVDHAFNRSRVAIHGLRIIFNAFVVAIHRFRIIFNALVMAIADIATDGGARRRADDGANDSAASSADFVTDHRSDRRADDCADKGFAVLGARWRTQAGDQCGGSQGNCNQFFHRFLQFVRNAHEENND